MVERRRTKTSKRIEICSLCQQYHASKYRRVKPHMRWCRAKRDYVAPEQTACQYFEWSKYIFCIEEGHQVTPEVCIHRQKKGYRWQCNAANQGVFPCEIGWIVTKTYPLIEEEEKMVA